MTGRVGNPQYVALYKRRSTGILRALKAAIRQGKPCPSNADLASAAGMTIIANLRDVLGRMKSAGLISIQYFGPLTSCRVNRSITICATGSTTLPTRDLAEARPSKPVKPQPKPRRACGGATNRTMGGAADVGSGRTAPIAASRPDHANQPYSFRNPVKRPPSSRELRAAEIKAMAEFAETHGILRVEGAIRRVHTFEQAVAALQEIEVSFSRRGIRCRVGGKSMQTSTVVTHVNRLLVERQTVRVKPEGMRA